MFFSFGSFLLIWSTTYAPINVKPQGGGRQATHGKLTEHAFPWVGGLTFERCPSVGKVVARWNPSEGGDREGLETRVASVIFGS